MIKALLFDVDGVLADTDRFHRDSLARAAEEFGFTVADAGHGTTLAKLAAAGVPEEFRARVYERKKALYNAAITDLRPDEYIVESLGKLRERFRMAAVSNSNMLSVATVLRLKGLLGLMEELYCAPNLPVLGKPDPGIYRITLHRMGVAAEEAVAFEDSDDGAASAEGAGIECHRITTETLPEELDRWLS